MEQIQPGDGGKEYPTPTVLQLDDLGLGGFISSQGPSRREGRGVIVPPKLKKLPSPQKEVFNLPHETSPTEVDSSFG